MFDDSRPIFLQLADHIADDIMRGTYGEGEQVPSTNELAAFMRINPATAGKALNQLVDEGILFKRRGIGMFVAEGARGRIATERQRGFAEAYVNPLLAEARVLGLSTEEVVDLITSVAATPQGAPRDSDRAALAGSAAHASKSADAPLAPAGQGAGP